MKFFVDTFIIPEYHGLVVEMQSFFRWRLMTCDFGELPIHVSSTKADGNGWKMVDLFLDSFYMYFRNQLLLGRSLYACIEF